MSKLEGSARGWLMSADATDIPRCRAKRRLRAEASERHAEATERRAEATERERKVEVAC